MLRRSVARVGDLQPVGVTRHLTVVRRDENLSPWVTISISCVSTLALFAAGVVWLDHRSAEYRPSPTHPAAQTTATEVAPPATFPSWVEVPHLTGPLSHAGDPEAVSLPDGPRSFLDPNSADTVEQPAFLPPRANPRLPLLGRAPLDAARLTHEQPPAWNERAERQDRVTPAPLTSVATLGPDVRRSSSDQAEPSVTSILPADPASAPILAPNPAQIPSPTEVALRPVQSTTVSANPSRVATLSPDPAPLVVDRTVVTTPPRDAEAVMAPILNPGPARHARSLRRRVSAKALRARVSYRDAGQTASVLSPPKPIRTRIDAGAVARVSLHRVRAVRSAAPSTAPASPPPWALPSALAPTD